MKFVDPKVDNELPISLEQEDAIKDAATTANRATWKKEELEVYEYGLREEVRELKMIQQLEKQSKELASKNKMLDEKDSALKRSILTFQNMGKGIDEIAEFLGIAQAEVKRILNN